MVNLNNISLQAFRIAIRWARMKKFPFLLSEWTPEHSEQVQAVAEELDRRFEKRACNNQNTDV